MQIIPKGPRYEYQVDITDILSKLKTDKYNTYILSIIDTFSKYGGCYLLNNKKVDNVLGAIKDFIYKN